MDDTKYVSLHDDMNVMEKIALYAKKIMKREFNGKRCKDKENWLDKR